MADDRYEIVYDIKTGGDAASNISRISQSLTRFDGNMQSSARNTRSFDMSLNGLAGNADKLVALFGGAFAGAAFLNWAGDMLEAGYEARNASIVFEAVVGDYENSMQRLREATMGAVNDTTLQNGASQLIRMEIAATADEAAEYMRIATLMGDSTKSAADNINNFTLMMANQSKLRLDTYGISAARVTEIQERLVASGQFSNMRDAFGAAVLEVAGDKLDQYGDALEGTITNWDVLRTHVENAASGLQQAASTIFDGLIGDLNVVLGLAREEPLSQLGRQLSDIQQSQGGEQLVNSVYNAFADAFKDDNPILNSMLDIDPGLLRSTLEERGIPADLATFLNESLNISLQPGAHLTGPMLDDVFGAFEGVRELRVRQEAEESAAAERRAEEARQFMQSIGAWTNEAISNSRRLVEVMAEVGNEAVQGQESVNNAWRLINENVDDYFATMDAFRTTTGGIEFMDPQVAADYRAEFERINAQVERLQSSDNPFIDEAQLDLLVEARDRMGEFADRADDAAQAFQDMSLSELFGQTNGGRLGEFTDLIMEQIDALGDEDLYAQMQDRFNRDTGRTTMASDTFANEFSQTIALMAQQMGADAASTAAEAGLAAYEQALIDGFSQPQAVENARQAIGYTIDPAAMAGQFTINPGMTGMDIMAQYGMTPEQLMAWTGAASMNAIPVGTFEMQGQQLIPVETIQEMEDASLTLTENLGEAALTDLSPVSDAMETASSYAMDMHNAIAEIGTMTLEPTIKPTLDASGIPAMFRDMFEAVVQDNGGVPPGTDQRRFYSGER